MSEHLQDREHRQEVLKGLITDLHNGRDFNEVKRNFKELIKGIDATEIADMEQRLIEGGMPPEEIKRMCDVHAAVFRDSLAGNKKPVLDPGHPLHTLKSENEEAGKIMSAIQNDIESLAAKSNEEITPDALDNLRKNIMDLNENVDKHFSKKENIFFPYLEKRGITGPPSVMWSVDDEIRDMLKGIIRSLEKPDNRRYAEIAGQAKESFGRIRDKLSDMFFKEEEILSPMMLEALSEEEFIEIKEQSSQFGVIFSTPESDIWKPGKRPAVTGRVAGNSEALELETGTLTPEQVNAILTNIPIDITFVDKNDEVRYFSQGRERIFTRTKAIIGRKVQNCHPPESVHMVERIVNDFRSGRHDKAHFWLELNGRFIHISYTALKDKSGDYLGTMEVSQDVTDLRALEGERRLLQYEN
ncbi:MAG: DUF438 domain-containing protein [Bacillota bacterium]